MLVYVNQTDKAKATTLVQFLNWVLTKGQDMCAQINYSPLGLSLWKKSVGQLYKIKLNGKPLVTRPGSRFDVDRLRGRLRMGRPLSVQA